MKVRMKRVKIKKRKEKEKKTKRKEKEKRKERKVQCLVRSKMFVVSDLVFWQNVECTTTIIITITMIVILLHLIIIVIFITSTIINFILFIILCYVCCLGSCFLTEMLRALTSSEAPWGEVWDSVALTSSSIFFVVTVIIISFLSSLSWLLVYHADFSRTPFKLEHTSQHHHHYGCREKADIMILSMFIDRWECAGLPWLSALRSWSSPPHDWDDLHSPLEGPQGACATP